MFLFLSLAFVLNGLQRCLFCSLAPLQKDETPSYVVVFFLLLSLSLSLCLSLSLFPLWPELRLIVPVTGALSYTGLAAAVQGRGQREGGREGRARGLGWKGRGQLHQSPYEMDSTAVD